MATDKKSIRKHLKYLAKLINPEIDLDNPKPTPDNLTIYFDFLAYQKLLRRVA